MANKPKASSTPKIVDVSARRRIGNTNNESVQSPINAINMVPESARHRKLDLNFKYEKIPESASARHRNFDPNLEHEKIAECVRRRNPDPNSEDEKSDALIDSNDETEHQDVSKEQEYLNRTFCNCINPVGVMIVMGIIFLSILLYGYSDGSLEEAVSLEQLSQEFPSQVEDFWLHIKIGIQEITKFHQPKTFLLLYNDESQDTVSKLLNKVSQFAVCTLSSCSAVPVVLEGNNLNTSVILKDYGRIIEKNKEDLKESGVMIIKNLEKIPGISAQAFHSFCDEYNPVVEKALFIFTMKVDKFPKNNVKFAENYLRNLWDDLEDDKFYALFTRISSIVLPVMVER